MILYNLSSIFRCHRLVSCANLVDDGVVRNPPSAGLTPDLDRNRVPEWRREELKTGEDKIMEIIKSMSTLGLVLLVLTSTAAASAEGGSYWAVALKEEELIGEYGYIRPRVSAYGAAWNLASLEEAKKAAMKECDKNDANGECFISYTGKDSCFMVVNILFRTVYWGTYTAFADFGPYLSRAEAEEAEMYERRTVGKFANGTHEYANTELVECSGVQ